MRKIIRSKKGERFEVGLLLVIISISISLLSFVTEENSFTGFAVAEQNPSHIYWNLMMSSRFQHCQLEIITLMAVGLFIGQMMNQARQQPK